MATVLVEDDSLEQMLTDLDREPCGCFRCVAGTSTVTQIDNSTVSQPLQAPPSSDTNKLNQLVKVLQKYDCNNSDPVTCTFYNLLREDLDKRLDGRGIKDEMKSEVENWLKDKNLQDVMIIDFFDHMLKKMPTEKQRAIRSIANNMCNEKKLRMCFLGLLHHPELILTSKEKDRMFSDWDRILHRGNFDRCCQKEKL